MTHVILVLPHVKGKSLMSQTVDYIGERFRSPDDPEQIVAGDVYFEVDARGRSFADVVDFLTRTKDVKEAGKLGGLSLLYDTVDFLPEAELAQEMLRVLRTLEGDDVWKNQDGSVLSTECIVDLLKQLFLSRPPTTL